jgi:adenosine deaminase
MSKITPEFIRAIPKTDLHVHLDGSLRIKTLIELAKERNVELPSYTEEGLRRKVFKKRYKDLGEYLHGFMYTCAVLQDPEALERVAYELACDAFDEGVRYLEPRFAPQLHINEEMEIPVVIGAVDKGFKRAVKEYNSKPKIKSGKEPEYACGIIVCAMRKFMKNFSNYYKKLLEVQKYSPSRSVFGIASLELARAAVKIRDKEGYSIVGFDLAGQENGYPPHDHIKAYRYAHNNFLKKTVHAGEAYGAESIFEAITTLYTNRIGHGYYLFNQDKVGSHIKDREKYINELVDYIADRRITIEICLTSNLQTNPNLKTLADHPIRKMLDAKISTTFCTDNRLVSMTTVSKELELAVNEIKISTKDFRECVFNGFKRSFMPFSYLEKRDYVRKVINYYDKLAKKYGVS